MLYMLFPELRDKIFGYVNLNSAAEQWTQTRDIASDQPNPLLDPKVCQAMVQDIHRQLGLDFSYGGWMEDRRSLWRGSYLDVDQKYLHLGTDFNVPPGTSVASDNAGVIVRVDTDVPVESGWGTRVVIRPDDQPVFILYAHLAATIPCRVGMRVRAGDVFARVGRAPHNGGWFPHLHVQCIDADHFIELFKNDLQDLDGYGDPADIQRLSRVFMDPFRFVTM